MPENSSSQFEVQLVHESKVNKKRTLKVDLGSVRQPSEVRAVNLELKALEAASKAARTLNHSYRLKCVEVLRRTTTNAPDGGIDVEVLYDLEIWPTEEDFMEDFFPLYQDFRLSQ